MEYFLGSLITLACVISISLFYKRKTEEPLGSITYSQSHVYNLIKPFMPSNDEMRESIESQSSKHLESQYTRLVIVDNHAYWILENTLYVADFDNGMVDKDTTTKVDTMAMDAIELKKTMQIVETLTEGKTNDRWNSGKS